MALYHIHSTTSLVATEPIKASSFDDAMEQAADYMSDGDWNADEMGTQRIRYTVYEIPDGMQAELGDDKWLDMDRLGREAEERDGTHIQQPTEPECPHGDHEFVADVEHEGGLKENPGVFGHGGSVVCETPLQTLRTAKNR